ncbi:MAG: ATP-binding protein [Anaerolineales bacterium]|nr:ATP-binding protein [Anaerolineales bacterium]
MKTENPFKAQSPYLVAERARRARLIDAVAKAGLYIAIPINLVVIPTLMLGYSHKMAIVAGLCLAIFPCCLLVQHSVKRGHVDAAAWFSIVGGMTLLFLNTQLMGGLNPLLVPGFLILIIAANLFLPSPYPYAVAAAASGLYLLERLVRIGSLAAPQVNPMAGDLFLTTATMVAFIFVAFLNQLITGDLHRALDDATHSLQEANRRLAQASEMKSQFTARTSHELRTPLSSIIAFTDLALRDSYGPLAPKLRDALTYVFDSSRHLKDIINDLLDLSKIEAGQLQMVDEAVSLPQLVEAVVGVAAPIVAEKGLRWSIAVSPDMPHEFQGDPSRLEQILLNLTGNALKFTEKGSVSMSIDRAGTNGWRVDVRDTGVGIPEDQFESIFEAYRQLNGTASPSKVKGTGLGLAITRHLVHLMGGTIRVESTLGKGSTFTVELPLRPMSAPA